MEIFILLAREDCWRDFYLDRRGASLQQLELRVAGTRLKSTKPLKKENSLVISCPDRGRSLHPGSFSEGGEETLPCKRGILLFSCA